MKNENLYKTLCEINGAGNVLRDEPMKKHTTFRIGGPARCFCLPQTAAQLAETVEACEEAGEPWYILGNGSNVLVSDDGYDGVVIQLFHNFEAVRIEGCLMELEAGVLLVKAARLAAREGLTGLEFASGIPGTLGGARKDGKLLRLKREELELGYRTSVIAREGYVVLSVLLELRKGDPEEIETRMQELRTARTEKQPLEYPSAGSTFKRPEGYFAGKLIMDAGLRGYRLGGAQVSEKHCGFVINTGDATAEDVMNLIRHVQSEVSRQFGVELEMEVKTLGF